ncbi:MAG: carbohydrate kinase family protein [Candidatus Dormibacteria bacterium]
MRRSRVAVIGNALVDEIRTPQGSFERFGGAGLNVAVTFARHGVETTLVAAVARDAVGAAICRLLSTSGVHLLPEIGHAVTARAVVHLERSEPTYEFSDASYPVFRFPAAVAETARSADVVIVNAFNYESAEQVERLRRLLHGATGWRVLDPNVRPALVGETGRLVSNLEMLLRFTDIVKASEEDLAALGDERGPYPVQRLLELGPKVVFLTRGSAGAEVLTEVGARCVAPAPPVPEMVDTVGAGDAALAALMMSALSEVRGADPEADWRSRLSSLDWAGHLRAALVLAAAACLQRGGPAGPVPAP